jgi:hypothetical protein
LSIAQPCGRLREVGQTDTLSVESVRLLPNLDRRAS